MFFISSSNHADIMDVSAPFPPVAVGNALFLISAKIVRNMRMYLH